MARFRFNFWLDCNKDSELLLADEIDQLKRQRSFTAAIRDGLRLIIDLRAGRLDVLFDLFPWVRAEFLEYIQSQTPPPTDLKQQLQRLEKLLLEQGNQPIAIPAGPKALQPVNGVGPKPLQTTAIPLPEDDDEDIPLKINKDTRKINIADNFLKSAMALQAMDSQKP
ncbi:MAG: hypothetical protein K8L99_19070 [Anaerolineae bacterium]|nr:hypothetical protein [Anaerolineae bacterium]